MNFESRPEQSKQPETSDSKASEEDGGIMEKFRKHAKGVVAGTALFAAGAANVEAGEVSTGEARAYQEQRIDAYRDWHSVSPEILAEAELALQKIFKIHKEKIGRKQSNDQRMEQRFEQLQREKLTPGYIEALLGERVFSRVEGGPSKQTMALAIAYAIDNIPTNDKELVSLIEPLKHIWSTYANPRTEYSITIDGKEYHDPATSTDRMFAPEFPYAPKRNAPDAHDNGSVQMGGDYMNPADL